MHLLSGSQHNCVMTGSVGEPQTPVFRRCDRLSPFCRICDDCWESNLLPSSASLCFNSELKLSGCVRNDGNNGGRANSIILH